MLPIIKISSFQVEFCLSLLIFLKIYAIFFMYVEQNKTLTGLLDGPDGSLLLQRQRSNQCQDSQGMEFRRFSPSQTS